RADADRCAETVAGAITCNHQHRIGELSTAEKCGGCVTGMMIGEPDRVCSKPHAENFRQTLAPAPLLVELKHRCLAKSSFQSRSVGARSLELRENPLPIASGTMICGCSRTLSKSRTGKRPTHAIAAAIPMLRTPGSRTAIEAICRPSERK